MEQIHYIYKITFLKGKLKGHYYIGKRTSVIRKRKLEWSNFSDPIEWAKNDAMFDNYTGSGRIPMDYFKKYNKELGVTFNKEIICFSDSFEDNRINEEKIIGDKYKTDPLCTNITKGGLCENPRNGKLSYTYGRVVSEEMKKHLSELNKERCKYMEMPWKGKHKTEEEKKQISLKLKEYYKTHKSHMYGKKHTDEAKLKNSESTKKRWENDECRNIMLESIRNYWKNNESPLIGTHLSEERKQKLSEYFRGKPNPKNKGKNNGMYGKTPPNARKIIQLTIDDVFIKEWNSIDEACRALSLHSSNIHKVCNGKRKTCGGFHWKYK